jgi:Family of unknown function (DUF5681)
MAQGNNATKTRGRPFRPGNPGRPKGARHRTTVAIESLLEGEGEALTRKAIELAKAGDMAALRLCLERILPARKDRPVQFELPPVNNSAGAARAMLAIVQAVATGEITPGEAFEVSRIIEAFTETLKVNELEFRIAALETKTQ